MAALFLFVTGIVRAEINGVGSLEISDTSEILRSDAASEDILVPFAVVPFAVHFADEESGSPFTDACESSTTLFDVNRDHRERPLIAPFRRTMHGDTPWERRFGSGVIERTERTDGFEFVANRAGFRDRHHGPPRSPWPGPS
jgi:hypothetical protein